MAMICTNCDHRAADGDVCPKCGGRMHMSLLADLSSEPAPPIGAAPARAPARPAALPSAAVANGVGASPTGLQAGPDLGEDQDYLESTFENLHNGLGFVLLGMVLLAVNFFVSFAGGFAIAMYGATQAARNYGVVPESVTQAAEFLTMLTTLLALGAMAAGLIGKFQCMSAARAVRGGEVILVAIVCDAANLMARLAGFVEPLPDIVPAAGSLVSLLGYTAFLFFLRNIAGFLKRPDLASQTMVLSKFTGTCIFVGVIGVVFPPLFLLLAFMVLAALTVYFILLNGIRGMVGRVLNVIQEDRRQAEAAGSAGMTEEDTRQPTADEGVGAPALSGS